MKNLTVKIFVGLFVVAAVLLQSCKKDSETYSFLLNERGAFVEEPGGTTSLGFTAINISSVTPTTVPQGWSVTVDMNERRISVTAPTTFPDDPKTLADGEEEEEENTNVRFGTVYLTGRSSGGSSVSTSLYVSLAETVDLTGQPSNCYIINKSNARYCIDVTRKGEDTEATMSPASVAILWETPYKVIEFPKLVDGKAYFYHAIGTDDDEKEFFNHGNALLGAFDAAGNLLWSWHLWCAEFDPADEQVELGGEVMMKRNLGAGVVSGTSEEDILASYGVYYQWGAQGSVRRAALLQHGRFGRCAGLRQPESARLSRIRRDGCRAGVGGLCLGSCHDLHHGYEGERLQLAPDGRCVVVGDGEK